MLSRSAPAEIVRLDTEISLTERFRQEMMSKKTCFKCSKTLKPQGRWHMCCDYYFCSSFCRNDWFAENYVDDCYYSSQKNSKRKSKNKTSKTQVRDKCAPRKSRQGRPDPPSPCQSLPVPGIKETPPEDRTHHPIGHFGNLIGNLAGAFAQAETPELAAETTLEATSGQQIGGKPVHQTSQSQSPAGVLEVPFDMFFTS